MNTYIFNIFVRFKIYMDTKLTLKLDQKVIEKAKVYARDQGISLSRMVEEYLESVTESSHSRPTLTPVVEKLSGVLHLTDKEDERKAYRDHLSDKYK